MEKERRYYDVWGDSVDLKDLLISIALCITGTLGGYIIAPNESPMPLVFGLAGGVIAFIACSVFIRPKRNVHAEEEEGS